MSTNTTNDFISVNEDIKQISQALLEESKTNNVLLIRDYENKTDNEPGVRYKRFDSVPLMEKVGLLEIVLPIRENRYPRNLFPYDSEIVKSLVYEVKINPDNLDKFIQNPHIEVYLEGTTSPAYNAEETLLQYKKLSIVKKTELTVLLCYEGLEPSKPISKKGAWFQVFYKFVENPRLEKSEIMAKWNTANENRFKSSKKTRSGFSYVTTVRRQILDGLRRMSPEIAKHVKIEKGKGKDKDLYNLVVN